jgi:UDP-N-acetylmuramate dehydrogenase
MQIRSNFSLKSFNTFGIEAKAKNFVAVHSLDELKTVLAEHAAEPKLRLW